MSNPATPASDKPARRPQMNVTASAEEAALIERAAKHQGLSVSAFMRMSAINEARRLGVQ